MKIRVFTYTIIILIITGLALWLSLPTKKFGREFSIRKGLDLVGGTHITYEADMSKIDSRDRDRAQASLIDVIRRRVDALGVAEPVIQSTKVGDNFGLIVELPGVQDIDEAMRIIGKIAQLEFKEQSTGSETEYNFVSTGLTGADLKRADVQFDQNGKPEIALEFTTEGGKKFAEITKKNVGKPLAIYLDEQMLSAPTVQEEIREGKAVITGQFDMTEAKRFAIQLNAGALPVPIKIVEQTNIGATLGTDAIKKSLTAGIIGLFLVGFFMIIYYRLPGFLATLALLIYTLLVIAIFKLSNLTSFGVTLTLAGISAFILSIGMAVDANILIFERLKEELRAGKTLGAAIDAGFARAWSSVRDSNISSLITCVILIWLGTGLVRGFAVILAIAILISMFTAIMVTRTFLRLTVNTRLATKFSWFGVSSNQIAAEREGKGV